MSGTEPKSPFPLFIPSDPRRFPGQRSVKILLRSAHVLLSAGLFGAYLFGVDGAARGPWLAGAIASGLLLLCLDLYETGAFLLQARGLIVLVKLAVLFVLPWFRPYEAWVLGVVMVGSVLSSHAPSKFRYFLIAGRGRIRGAETKG